MPGTDRGQWWKGVFFGLHYDLHANAEDTELGAELTHEHLREALARVAPDFVQCDCKGHAGYTSYPTRVGSPSPGIVRDALRIHRDVTNELGLPLSVHYSGVWDTRAIELHPEWSVLDPDGRPVPSPGGKPGIICRLGPYVNELMIPQMLEIIDEYDVDGFWVDGDNWAVRDCYCSRCREEFRRRTGIAEAPTSRDHPDWPAWRAFQRATFDEYVHRYTDAVHARKPSCAVCSNWMYSMRHPGPAAVPLDYLSGDFTPSFGCERAEMEGRYLDGHRLPWNLMAWTFCSPDANKVPWQTKTLPHLCQEAAEVMSCGGAVFLYDQPRRTGWLTDWHQKIFAGVADFCRERRQWCENTRSVPEAVVFLSDSHLWKHNPEPYCLGDGYFGAEGALHALVENQYAVDVLDETRLLERVDEYGLVAVGEQDPVVPAVAAVLERFVRAGGTVLLTGAGVADAHAALAGVEPAGPPEEKPWHLAVRGEAATLAGPWRPVHLAGAEACAPVMRQQQPGKDETEYPAATIHRLGAGCVVAIHGDFMRNYLLTHHPRLRLFLRELLASVPVRRRLDVAGPPSLEVALREREGLLAVHLVNRAAEPTLTPRLHVVEDVLPTGPVSVRVRIPSRPARVLLQPGDREVQWGYKDGWLEAQVESVHIHEILTVE